MDVLTPSWQNTDTWIYILHTDRHRKRQTHTHGYYMLHTDRHTPILTAVDVLTPFWQPFRQTYRHRHMDIHTPHRQTDTGRDKETDIS